MYAGVMPPSEPAGSTPRRRSRGLVRGSLIGLALLLGGAILGWAFASVLTPPVSPLDAESFVSFQVDEGEVGASLVLNVFAEWGTVPAGTNRASGVVTSVLAKDGDLLSQGGVLYTVDMRPVVIAAGGIPAYRDLALGDEGQDVAQVQQMLIDLGHLAGEADGKFGPPTASAALSWQRALGSAATGSIALGDLVFVPALPARVTVDAALVTRGGSLGGGEAVVGMLQPAPTFSLPVSPSQSDAIPAGASVSITSAGGATWDARVGARTDSDDGQTVLIRLESSDDRALCGDACGEIPVNGESKFTATVITVPAVSGLVVPTTALGSSADGATFVVGEAGERLPVTVVLSAGGQSVIEGVTRGTTVRVPAKRGGA